MKVALLYLDALKGGGYPRDARWLAGSLAERCEKVWVVAEKGERFDGLGAAEPVSPGRAIRSLRADVVHGLGLLIPRQIVIQRAIRGHVNVISPLGQLMEEHMSRGRLKSAYLRLVRPVLPRNLTVHLFSEQERTGVHQHLPGVPIDTAPAGVFPPAPGFAGVPRSIDEGYLLFFGRNDVHQKGIDRLIRGYSVARMNGLELPLVIAGAEHAGSSRILQELAAELCVEVDFRGELSEPEKWSLLAGARALVFLSRWDGPPRPIREALAVGTPVVVSNGTNMAELVAGCDAGTVAGDSPDQIAAALAMAADPIRASAWRSGALSLASALAWPEVARSYERLYRGALAAKGM